MSRTKLLIAALAATTLTLTACSAPSADPSAAPSAAPSASASPSAPAITPSKSLDALKVEGEAGKAPKITVPAPWAIDETRAKVLSPGSGTELAADSVAVVHYFGVNGRTGEKFDESYSRGEPVSFPLNRVVPGFAKGLTGQKVGSRVLIAMPGVDGYDASGGNLQAGIQVGDTLVFVVDIVDGSLSTATGTAEQLPAGAPSVAITEGKPVVTIPGSAAPSRVEMHYLIRGKGKAIAANSTIGVKYVGYSWQTGKLVDDHYAALDQGELAKTIEGWQKGLVGVPLGSRVELIVPNAYPQGSNNPPVGAGDTIVYVIDVLYVK